MTEKSQGKDVASNNKRDKADLAQADINIQMSAILEGVDTVQTDTKRSVDRQRVAQIDVS